MAATAGAPGVGRTLHVAVGRVTAGRLSVHDALLVKHGAGLVAAARLDDADLRGALPLRCP